MNGTGDLWKRVVGCGWRGEGGKECRASAMVLSGFGLGRELLGLAEVGSRGFGGEGR